MPSLLDNEIIIENDELRFPVNLRDDESLYVVSQEPVHVGYRSDSIRIRLPLGNRKLKEKEHLSQRSYCGIGKGIASY